jgi:phage baseplate assembly protein gpV
LERATCCGLHFFLDEDVLEILTLEGAGAPLSLTLGESLLEARLEVNGDPACRSVSTLGWDPQRVLELRGSTQSPRVGRRVETEVEPAKVGGTGQRTLVNEPLESADQAEAMAQAELDLRFAKEVTFWGVAEGDPRLRPGRTVEVQGVAAEVAGRYILADVIHTVDNKKGYISELSSSPPLPRPRSRATVATLGIVTNVSDPDGLGRVKVSLPAFSDVGTDWLAVVTAGAGKDKGLIFIPDIDDRVLVLLNNEDPAQGVVVGGLYGSKTEPPDDGVVDNAVRRCTFLTAGGQRVQLDDEHGTIRLENRHGSCVELSPEKVLVHSEATLIVEAPGKQISIRGGKIDFEEA